MTESEARERYKNALAVECDSCFRRPGDWCVCRPGTTWSLCSRRVALGAAHAKLVATARKAYLAGATEVRRTELGDNFRMRETSIEQAFDEWWGGESLEEKSE